MAEKYIKCGQCDTNYTLESEGICDVCKRENDKTTRVSGRVAKVRLVPRRNIAFKCNYCDGGSGLNGIGFAGICSDDIRWNNVKKEARTWCCAEENVCSQLVDKKISRAEFDAHCKKSDDFLCYESKVLVDWSMAAGSVVRGKNKGQPNRLLGVRTNSLCVLTSREPKSDKSERFIFGVFLVDCAEEGDNVTEGKVTAHPKYRISLTRDESRKLLFFRYYSNNSDTAPMQWGTGLFRYIDDETSVQILRDIVAIKKGTDGGLAEEFLQYFCTINKIDLASVGEPSGAL